jgi:hypothetical protein
MAVELLAVLLPPLIWLALDSALDRGELVEGQENGKGGHYLVQQQV